MGAKLARFAAPANRNVPGMEGVFEWISAMQCAHPQLLQQCCNNLLVWDNRGELHHAAHILRGEASPELRLQLSRQCSDNSASVLRRFSCKTSRRIRWPTCE
jgi:hypothetical protein